MNISKTKAEFDQFFNDKLEGKIGELEKERNSLKEKRNQQLMYFGIAFLIPIVIAQFMYGVVLYTVAFGILVFAVIKISETYQSFTGKMKEEITRDIVTFINPNFQYDPKGFIPEKTFLETKLFVDKPDRYRGDDLIWGTIGDEKMKIAFSEVDAIKIKSNKGSDGNSTHKIPIFNGLFFDVDFNKDFTGTTVIVPKKNLLFDFDKVARMSEYPELTEIELDNYEFDQRFKVMTTDEVKARYILTPRLMEKLVAFVDETQNRMAERFLNRSKSTNQQKTEEVKERIAKQMKPYFSFQDGKLAFLLNTNSSHFEFNIDQKPDKQSLYYDFEDINQSLELVEELDLNVKLWSTA